MVDAEAVILSELERLAPADELVSTPTGDRCCGASRNDPRPHRPAVGGAGWW